uniref:(northern house mosquito) hypothetical protein n=1 Tax=Culex pipiens TaxID=7175 RepID=A0A8D8MLD7_CULPI
MPTPEPRTVEPSQKQSTALSETNRNAPDWVPYAPPGKASASGTADSAPASTTNVRRCPTSKRAIPRCPTSNQRRSDACKPPTSTWPCTGRSGGKPRAPRRLRQIRTRARGLRSPVRTMTTTTMTLGTIASSSTRPRRNVD